MNQGIFGFRKYENASLSYTGIDKHDGEAVGGWDTVLKREEYEALYSKQQATMTDFEEILIPEKYRKESSTKVADLHVNTESSERETGSNKIKTTVQDEWEEILSKVNIGIEVIHKKFGVGIVSWIGSDKKYMRVKFSVGEKQFVFPDAFILGFLALK